MNQESPAIWKPGVHPGLGKPGVALSLMPRSPPLPRAQAAGPVSWTADQRLPLCHPAPITGSQLWSLDVFKPIFWFLLLCVPSLGCPWLGVPPLPHAPASGPEGASCIWEVLQQRGIPTSMSAQTSGHHDTTVRISPHSTTPSSRDNPPPSSRYLRCSIDPGCPERHLRCPLSGATPPGIRARLVSILLGEGQSRGAQMTLLESLGLVH